MQDLNQYATMNPTFSLVEASATENKAELVIEPLEQGFGHTLGNALRRVLLTSLPGVAITAVTIDGVDHQYSTLAGLTEDVVELILNLKQVRIKTDHEGKGTLHLNVKGAKTVTAGDIECEAGFVVANPDQYLATLAKGKTLEVELAVETGMGYRLASEVKSEVIGQIMIDALFSPVVKTSYRIEATRVGRKTDYDRIVLSVQTDGTLTPQEAVKQAAQILARQFTQVFAPVMPEIKEEAPILSPEEAETMKLTVEELDLPTRIANALRKGSFKTVGDLLASNKGVISKVKNLGGKSVDLINEALQKKGVSIEE
ncbi:MAG TPA: DNA-directed RNA polymerase subunit alpha [Candidatus Pacebacteria bacterium]|nr:DNA-directed RNA polymerase subunit alpha [Candidatus Paceibacterota bacterium]